MTTYTMPLHISTIAPTSNMMVDDDQLDNDFVPSYAPFPTDTMIVLCKAKVPFHFHMTQNLP